MSFFTLNQFNIHQILRSLTEQGFASVPLLQEEGRLALLREAESLNYLPDVKVVGTGDRIVRTEYSAWETFTDTSLYTQLMQDFQALMNQAIGSLQDSPFAIPLQFNSMVLQRYEPGQLGITPHRDSLRAINLVCIFNISGQASLYRCDDRQGTNSVQIDTTPGHVVFMRAPGFMGTNDRPFHYVTDIRSTRYSLGLRQRRSD
ncbi:hypothetical protein C7B61_11150 [filamentous cyanobacterium CCP1]|nr:hypothetical protein C7B76_20960 [filamentous cyanobacterium CCP2]PSB65565.1 hypothetical protein C7B61_11150 [filamentous cyanobacterium CCP1]